VATLCKTLPTTEAALHAAEALSTAGVPAGDIGVLTGHPYHNVRAERVGGLGGPIGPDAPLGKFAGPPRLATDDERARRLLTRAQVPDDVARRMVRHLHEGEAILFVQLAQVDLGTAEALIGHSTVAA
jgi:hypothetical protein